MHKEIIPVDGSYCFNLVNPLIDYKGDVAKNNNSDSIKSYSEDYSPNNIRRLILSGDGVEVHFHVEVEKSLYKRRVFSDIDKVKMRQSMCVEKYKPMLWVLAERVCSSIEEVIICTQNNGGMDLSRELDFSGLLKRTNGVSDVKGAIMQRYSRLAYFTIVNCDIETLIRNPEVQSCFSPYKLISETNFVKSCGKVTPFSLDWYMVYGHHSAYSLDKEGSRLNNHFKTVKAEFEKNKRNKAIKDSKEARLREVYKKFDKPFRNYRGIYTCVRNLSLILQKEGFNYLCEYLDLLNIKLPYSPDKLKEDFYKLSDRDDCEKFITNMSISSTSMYSALADWFFKGILKLKLKYKFTCNIFLDSMERRIVVPPNCKDTVEKIGFNFTGKDMSSSVANICAYSCLLFVTDVGEHDMSKYYEKSYWLGHFEGGVK